MGKDQWHVLRVLYCMIRKGISKKSLLMDLHLLLKSGKIAGKAIGNLITFHHHHHLSTTLSCGSMDPNLACYNPREVEFSCSNTPLYPTKRNRRNYHNRHRKLNTTATARAFEILNSETAEGEKSKVASPSPAVSWRSPESARQLRVTDSPFPIREEDEEEVGEGFCRVDAEAEEFIRRFYEQLRLQQNLRI